MESINKISVVNKKNMRTQIIRSILFFIVFAFAPKGYSQNADPSISIIIAPASVPLGATATLSATVGNVGNSTIVSNSLRVTISVGVNAQITGIAAGSDPRWTQLNLTSGVANTMLLTNSGGGFTSFDLADILLSVNGSFVGGPSVITSNVVYITGFNPLLCTVPGCPSPPQNVSQGNANIGNDNASTTLNVTSNLLPAVTLSTVTQPTCLVANGSFTITNYNAAYTYAASPAVGVVIVGDTITAPAGTYTVTATSGALTS